MCCATIKWLSDGAAAKEYSEEAHRYLDECHGYNDEFQRYVEERRDLVDRAPGEAHVSAKEFWGMKYIQEGSKKVKVKRHDHYMPDGSPAGKHKNRGNYTGDLNRD